MYNNPYIFERMYIFYILENKVILTNGKPRQCCTVYSMCVKNLGNLRESLKS